MSLRAFFSRLFSSRSTARHSDNGLDTRRLENPHLESHRLKSQSSDNRLKAHTSNDNPPKIKWLSYLLQFLFA